MPEIVLISCYAISENFIMANRVLIDAAAIAGVALDGVNNAVFDFLDNTDMIGLAILRTGAALVIPIEEDNHARRGLHRVIRPLPTLPEPLDTVDAACELGNDTGIDIAALERTRAVFIRSETTAALSRTLMSFVLSLVFILPKAITSLQSGQVTPSLLRQRSDRWHRYIRRWKGSKADLRIRQ